jgi:hypothetical protein
MIDSFKKFVFWVYKLDTIWYNLKRYGKLCRYDIACTKGAFSFLSGNVGCALPKAKPVLPVLFPAMGAFSFSAMPAQITEMLWAAKKCKP